MTSNIDFALAFAVVHEVPNQKQLFIEMSSSLKKGGLLLISEPKGHVTKEEFEVTLSLAKCEGLKVIEALENRQSFTAVLEKI